MPFVVTNVEIGRDDQVRLERLPRHQDLVHQRGGRALRGGRRRRRGGGARHGPRQPHRPEVPPPRPRLRRLLLPQGHPRRGADRRASTGCASRSSRRCCRSTSACSAAWSSKIEQAFGGARRARPSAVLGLVVQGRHRRHARVAGAAASSQGCSSAAPRVRAFDPAAMEQAASDASRTVDLLRRRLRGGRAAPTALVIATEWNQFRALDLDRPASALLRAAADRRPAQPLRAGSASPRPASRYVSVGRPPRTARRDATVAVTAAATS